MSALCRPEHTYAILVGIERYDTGDDWDLDGPASDAVRFALWLLGHGVPSGNIYLFLRPLDPAARQTEFNQHPHGAAVWHANIDPARDRLEEFLSNGLTSVAAGAPHGVTPLLFLLWGGHGVARGGGERHLFYANITAGNLVALKVDNLFESLRAHPRLIRQVVFIDSCANYFEDSGLYAGLTSSQTIGAHFRPTPGLSQSALFSASSGEFSLNNNIRRTGYFSEAVRAELDKADPAHAWPPPLDSLYQTLTTYFDSLAQSGAANQRPCRFEARENGSPTYNLGHSPSSPAILKVWQDTGVTADQFHRLLAAAAASDYFRDADGRDSAYSHLLHHGAALPKHIAERAQRGGHHADLASLLVRVLASHKMATFLDHFKESDLTSPAYLDCLGHWSSIQLAIESRALLKSAPLTTAEYRQLFKETLGARASAATPASLEEIFDTLASLGTGAYPLCEFLLRAAARVPALAPAIDAWVEARLSTADVQEIRDRLQAQERVTVVIVVLTRSARGQNETLHAVRSWLRRSRYVFEPFPSSATSSRPVSTTIEMENAVRDILESALELCPAGFDVELALPLSLLAHPFDQLAVNLPGAPVALGAGAVQPLFVRSHDRIRYPAAYKPDRWRDWAARVRRRMTAPGHPNPCCLFLADPAQPGDPNALDASELVATCALPPEAEKRLVHLLRQGVAYGLICRVAPADPDAHAAELQQLVAIDDFYKLPAHFADSREKEHLPNEISLLWDDPDSPLKHFLEEPKPNP